jgi:hypothetical protein
MENLLKNFEDYELNVAFDKIMKYVLDVDEVAPELTNSEKAAIREYIFRSDDPLVQRWHEIETLKGKKIDR